MADFVAVLKKTIDGMGETTPAMRDKVYDKARATVEAKLAAINPPPVTSVADRQRRILEDAILQVEAAYSSVRSSAPLEDPFAELEKVFARADEVARGARPDPRGSWKATAPSTAGSMPTLAGNAEPMSLDTSGSRSYQGDDVANDEFQPAAVRKRSYGGLIAALVATVVVLGGGYGIWLNADAFGSLLGLGGQQTATTDTTQPAAANGTEPAAADAPASGADQENPKFTQRLNSDGSETDEGPAGGEPTVGEGTSVAAVSQAVPGSTPDILSDVPRDPAAAPAAASTDGAAADPTAVAVGQKAIFYEERTNVDQGSADTGGIVWSLIQQSPGGDLPPEPAIRAEATIPDKNLQLRMTISRNMDNTLPASHIIELIFLTPENFEGGGIENILRFTMKDSEQAAGSPLLGIPAKIADGFFLVALNDTKAETESNLRMLLREKWIDVPLVYKSGRRALITLEKGVPGEQVFNEAIKAWQTAGGSRQG